jgi:hypothetical protein
MQEEAQLQGGRMTKATMEQMQDYDLILTNERGDRLWRFFSDGRCSYWKVWAQEPAHRAVISKWQYTKRGAAYYKGTRYIGHDYIIPRKYLLRVAKLLGLNLQKNPRRRLSPDRRRALQDHVAVLNRRRAAEKITEAKISSDSAQ